MNSETSLLNIIECLVFVSEPPITVEEISKVLKSKEKKEIERALCELKEHWEQMDRSLVLANVAGGYQFRTRPEYSDYIVEFNKELKNFKLSKAGMEVLAIISYRQPVTKIEVEKIRGVDSTSSVKILLDRRFIEIAGRKDAPGNPFLYRTTDLFLETFGLKDLKDLPTLGEIEKITQTSEDAE